MSTGSRIIISVAFAAGCTGWWFGRGKPAPVLPRPEPAPESDSAREPRVRVPVSAPVQEPHPAPAAAPLHVQLNDTALACLEQGDLEQAIRLLERCLAAQPMQQVYERNLSEALARLAQRLHEGDAWDRGQAIESLERAVHLNPQREALSELLDRWRRSEDAEQDFYTRNTLHFEVAFDLDREEVRRDVQTIATVLEEAYQQYGERLGVRPADGGQPIRVVLYTRAGFDQVTGVGEWAGGVYDGTIRVPVGDLARELPRVIQVLRHELLHAFVQIAGGRSVPGWLNEGLAQWFEAGIDGPSAKSLEQARQSLARGPRLPLEQLRGSLASWTDQDLIERAYAQSLLLITHLVENFGERLVFDMVSGCSRGEDPGQTVQRQTALSLELILGDL